MDNIYEIESIFDNMAADLLCKKQPLGISCIFCDEVFFFNLDYQPVLRHLCEVHSFVIGAPEEIADFRCYLAYWKKLRNVKLEDYCIVYSTKNNHQTEEASQSYYFLCDKLPEDKYIRMTLQEMKLNFVTHQKEIEFQDKNFSRQCIYCPAVIGGGVNNSFHHLTFDHGFSLGNPDNIVFAPQLLDIMDEMLQRLQCLYCEKTFKNHLTLREHMRKKQHRSLNPKNKFYDTFYLSNYLKPGTPWEEIKKKLLEEKLLLQEDLTQKEDAVEDEQLWTDWREDSKDKPAAACLFCPFTTTQISSLYFSHMDDHHHFSFKVFTQDLNFYAKVKIINFIRTQVRLGKCPFCDSDFESQESLVAHLDNDCQTPFPPSYLWNASIFLIPAIENDGLLIHLEDNDIEDEDTSSVASSLSEMVFAEETVIYPSILDDWKLREELSKEAAAYESDTGTVETDVKTMFFKCLFCSYSPGGNDGRMVCLAHMNSMHNFNLKSLSKDLHEESRRKLINYIRTMTQEGQCFVCRKSYMTRGALEEHRILENHTHLPPASVYKDEKWNRPVIPSDGFHTSCA